MKVVALNGSPKKEGNTATGIKVVLEVLEKEGIETEFLQLGASGIKPCRACGLCFEKKDGFCVQTDDVFNSWIEKVYGAEGLIIGSPVYFGGVSGETKAFIDRTGMCAIGGGYKLKRKVGASVIAARRQGAVEVFNQINSLYALNQVIIPCSIFWNMGMGTDPGDVLGDEEGMDTFKTLGENMAWLIKKICQ